MTGEARTVDILTLREAADLVRKDLLTLPIAAVGPVLEFVFPAADTARDIAHGLQVAPDGYLIVLQSGGLVQASQVHLWTATTAWLQASAANTRVRVLFYKLREGAIIHVVP